MKRLLLIAALAAGPAMADLVARHKDNELRLQQGACTHEGILATLKPEFHDKFQRGQAMVAGKLFQACWIDTREGVYFVAFEDGAMQTYPITMFVEIPGI
jgi:hypothetical protein